MKGKLIAPSTREETKNSLIEMKKTCLHIVDVFLYECGGSEPNINSRESPDRWREGWVARLTQCAIFCAYFPIPRIFINVHQGKKGIFW